MYLNNLEATSFIKEALSGFITAFPNTRIRYEFDIDANVHCVEVVPNDIYHLENDYINWENNFTNNFIVLFPYQNICFFSDDAIVGINNIQFELIGSKYVDLISTNDCKSYINLAQIHIFNSSNYLNLESISSATEVFNNGIASQVKQSNIIIDQANSLTSIENQNQALFSINYPMAA
tara:strand:- start:91 stop:624 length:534 start_codon:yes stop_codon:yes gene_type:complete